MNTQDFLQTPVRKLFFHYLLPSIFGTMVTSIYVLADTIMIGKGIGTVAMAALNIALPVYNIFFGLGLLTGVGGSVLMSIARGKGEKQKADAYFTASLLLTLSLLAVCMVICTVFMEEIAWMLGGTGDQTSSQISADTIRSGMTSASKRIRGPNRTFSPSKQMQRTSPGPSRN